MGMNPCMFIEGSVSWYSVEKIHICMYTRYVIECVISDSYSKLIFLFLATLNVHLQTIMIDRTRP